MLGPFRVARSFESRNSKLIPSVSTAGPLRVFGSRGPGGVAYIGVLNCEGLLDHNVYSAGSSCVAIASCGAISAAGFTLTKRNTYIW